MGIDRNLPYEQQHVRDSSATCYKNKPVSSRLRGDVVRQIQNNFSSSTFRIFVFSTRFWVNSLFFLICTSLNIFNFLVVVFQAYFFFFVFEPLSLFHACPLTPSRFKFWIFRNAEVLYLPISELYLAGASTFLVTEIPVFPLQPTSFLTIFKGCSKSNDNGHKEGHWVRWDGNSTCHRVQHSFSYLLLWFQDNRFIDWTYVVMPV